MRVFFNPFNPGDNPIIHLQKGELVPMVCRDKGCRRVWVPSGEDLKTDTSTCPGCGTIYSPSEYEWEPVHGY